ncbi:MFS transporter [Candidatus Bathyarchaeota archaeon]|nr:MAG: MFS transporter [Candidatus Bathyarchaeota archaeon]
MSDFGSEDSPKKGILNEFSFIKGNFLIILTGWLLVDFAREMAFTFYPLYVTELGGTATILGIISSIAVLTDALVKIPGGHLADKFRRKRLIIVMTLLASAFYLIYAFAPSWHYILLGAVLTSFCWIYSPGFESIVMESLPEDKRGTGYSLINLITKVSTTPSPLIAGYLFTRYGVIGTSRIGFILVSVAFLVASLLRWRLHEETDKPEVTTKDVLASLSSAKGFTEGIGVWREVPRTLTALLSVELLFLVPNIMFNTIMTLYIVNDLGITEVQFSQLGAIIGVAMIIFAIPMGKIIDRFGRVRPLLFGYALTAAAVPLLLEATFTRLIFATPIIGLINIVFYTATQALWADLIPEDKRGRVMGSKSFFSLIAVSGGSILGGLIYDNISHTLPIYIFWAVNIPCFILTWLYIKEPKKSLEEIMQ